MTNSGIPGAAQQPATVRPITPERPKLDQPEQLRQLSLQRAGERIDMTSSYPLAKLEAATQGDPYLEARGILDMAIQTADGDEARHEALALMRECNPSKSEAVIARYTQLWLAEKYIQAARKAADNDFEGQDLYRPRVFAVIEASIVASMEASLSGTVSGPFTLATPAQTAARELDVDFARKLGFDLHAYVVDNTLSMGIEEEIEERLKLGGSPDRNLVRRDLIIDTVECIVSGTAENAGDSSRMNDEDRSIALRFCKEMSEGLTEGIGFTQRVDAYLKVSPQASRDTAQEACSIHLAQEVLTEMEQAPLTT